MKLANVAALGVFLAMLSAPLSADEVSKTAKLAELVKLTGLTKTIDSMRAESLKRGEALRLQYLKQLKDGMPDAPAELWARFDGASERFQKANQSTWSTDDAVALFGKLYGSHVTEDELDQILVYYRSPIGQKDVQASNAATVQWSAQLAEKYQGTFQANVKVFVDDIASFVNQCKAAKAAGSKTCEMPAAKKTGA